MAHDAASETTAKETSVVSSPPAPPSPSAPPAKPHKNAPLWRTILILVVAVVVAVKVFQFIVESLNTVSTDDAYVNSHVTFTAPRVPGQVMRVLVDDNNRVKKGELVVELDKEPYRVDVNIKQAAVDSAQADYVATEASIRGLVAQARSQRFKLLHAIETVDNQVALLRANVAAVEKAKATLTLAKAEFDRYKKLLETKVASREEYDQRLQNLDVAKAEFDVATENVVQSRVNLGLPAKPESGDDLAQVPPDLDQTFSTVRQAQSDLLQSAAQLSIFPTSYNQTPKAMLEEFFKRDPGGDIDKIYDKVMKEAPSLKQASARLMTAKRDLDQAQLNLRYCDIFAEIDGVVTRRNVNPGNNVQAGQSLMAIRSLTEIWVDANLKRRNSAISGSGCPWIWSSICTGKSANSKAGSPVSRREQAPPLLCFPRRTRPAISSRSCNACRCASSLPTMIRTSSRSSWAFRSRPWCTFMSRRPGPAPASFSRSILMR